MGRIVTTSWFLPLTMACLFFPLLGACGGDGESTPTQPTAPPPEPVVITIGNLTDLSSVASNAFEISDMALEDIAAYYTEANLIPGVRFEVITYDTRFDPARDIPAYEWLKGKGADFFVTALSTAAQSLKDLLEQDQTMLVAGLPIKADVHPPGRTFAFGRPLPVHEANTLLDWVARNDPGFPQGRPAKIGVAAWPEPYGEGLMAAVKAYCEAHPELFEWVGGFVKFTINDWQQEIITLKDCDYVIPPVETQIFTTQYREAGGQAKFLGTIGNAAFIHFIRSADAWDEVDGMIFVSSFRWWNEDGDTVNLAKQILRERHPDKADEILGRGSAYQAAIGNIILYELIGEVVETTGPENFTAQALYETAQSFSIEIDGATHNFNETKRTSPNYLAIYELRAEGKDAFRLDPEWIPIVYEP